MVIDYADQRYYASTYGRFNTADPYGGSAGTSDPGSWNRYSYTRGDPVNRNDRRGLCDATFCVDVTEIDVDVWEPPDGNLPDPSTLGDTCYLVDNWGANAFAPMLGGELGLIIQACAFAQIGGGGGGGNGYRQMSEGEESALLSAAYDTAMRLLTQHPDCASALFNSQIQATDLLASLYSETGGTISWGMLPNYALATTTGYVDPESGVRSAIIELNDNANGGFAQAGTLANAGTLLHELGHAYAFIYGDNSTNIRGNDNANLYPPGSLQAIQAQENQDWNNYIVNTNCLN